MDGSDHALKEAFASVCEGCMPLADKPPAFTRRMAVTLADMFGAGPMTMVLRLERMGLVRQGSFDWFKANGGITRDHVDQVRRDASSRLAAKRMEIRA